MQIYISAIQQENQSSADSHLKDFFKENNY